MSVDPALVEQLGRRDPDAPQPAASADGAASWRVLRL